MEEYILEFMWSFRYDFECKNAGFIISELQQGSFMSTEFVPKWIAWETTQKCNMHCVHCRCSSDLSSSVGDFTTAEGKKLLADIAEFSKPVVVLSGGEPLLRPDIFELAEYGTSLGLRMCMATNGSLVTDEICLKMKQADIKMVSLSLDGSTAEVHDNFRQSPGSFEGVARAAEIAGPWGVCCACHREWNHA